MIKKGSLVEIEHDYIEYKNDVKVFFRGICIRDCNIGEYANIKMMSGHLMGGMVYKNMNSYSNVHHLSKKAREIVLIKSF